MEQIRIVYVDGSLNSEKTVRDACERYGRDTGIRVEPVFFDVTSIDTDPLVYAELVDACKGADIVLIRFLYAPQKFARLGRILDRLKDVNILVHCPNADLSEAYRPMFKGNDMEWNLMYLLLGDIKNVDEYEVVKHCTNIVGLTDEDIRLPVSVCSQGIYTKGESDPSDILPDDLGLDETRPTMGILIRTYMFRTIGMGCVDMLVDHLRSYGLQTLTVIFPGASTVTDGPSNAREVFSRYFMKDGRSRIDAVICISPFSLLVSAGCDLDDESNFLKGLTGVPVFQTMLAQGGYLDFSDMRAGADKKTVSSFTAWAELDGQIDTVPIGALTRDKDRNAVTVPIPDRIDHLARTVRNWVSLRRKDNADKKVAIITYQKMGDNGRIGSAAGLDSAESIVAILHRLKTEGYRVENIPPDGRTLLDILISRVNNDFDAYDDEEVRMTKAGLVNEKTYSEWFEGIPEFNRRDTTERWGEPPGDLFVTAGSLVVPGTFFGNILVTMQPLRSWDDPDRMYHDPVLPPHHQYNAFHLWLRESFHADAVIHLGTHGNLEWLPGKNTGLSSNCYPDIALDCLPNIYPYIIDNPGEGVQAKRRSEAVLDGYSAPTMVRSELSGALEELDGLTKEYLDQGTTSPERDRTILLDKIRLKLMEESIGTSLGIDSEDPELPNMVGTIADRLEEIRDTLMPYGLHVMGRNPEGRQLVDSVVSSLRVKGDAGDSLRDAVADAFGFDRERDIEPIEERCTSIVQSLYDTGFEPGTVPNVPDPDGRIGRICDYICTRLVPSMLSTGRELDTVVDALSGKYIVPGPPGAVSRGQTNALPTGRNTYGIDPDALPTRTGWENGVRNAETMLARYTEEHGAYPNTIAFVIFATDTMKNNGEDLAYILWLMGIRPTWQRNGHIGSLEPIPLEELKRPRLDVVVRITGLFRDVFPNLVGVVNRAVEIASSLDESEEDNYLRANLSKEIAENIESGIPEDEAVRLAKVRVLGGRAGTYSGGIMNAIYQRNWDDVDDLAQVYKVWGGRGFTGDGVEVEMEEAFVRKLTRANVGVKNMPDRQIDVFTGDDVFSYLGGIAALTKSETGRDLELLIGDTADPSRPKVRTATEECGLVMRSRFLNERYLEGLEKHGYHGATVLAITAEYMIGWAASCGAMEDWMFKEFAEHVVFGRSREWIERENPYSLLEIVTCLIECVDRKLWNADDEMVERLRDVYLEVEGSVEESDDRLRRRDT
ncbi:MAG: cobaltochelatase subunit CobN [Candidatus Methanomethylophilaceae archaeon]|nr:cobaltochelatase subunit CobN [Candidatus Methanomethylophilaceae archaeon]